MALPKASIGNSASFQISGTPYIGETDTGVAETINFKYVTRAITVQCTVADSTIHFGDSTDPEPTQFPIKVGEIYRFEVKCKNLTLTPAAGAVVSIVAELTNVESGQLAVHDQADWATVT